MRETGRGIVSVRGWWFTGDAIRMLLIDGKSRWKYRYGAKPVCTDRAFRPPATAALQSHSSANGRGNVLKPVAAGAAGPVAGAAATTDGTLELAAVRTAWAL